MDEIGLKNVIIMFNVDRMQPPLRSIQASQADHSRLKTVRIVQRTNLPGVRSLFIQRGVPNIEVNLARGMIYWVPPRPCAVPTH